MPSETPENTPAETDWPLESRPGYLIRRLHQIHVGLFNDACADFKVTPLQYSLMTALATLAGAGITSADQTTLANHVALDRTTTTGALKRLESRGFIRRERSTRDRRSHESALTQSGREVLRSMEESARRAHRQTLSGLGVEEADLFMTLLKQILKSHDRTEVIAPACDG